jgi:4-amino-4-deoxy-L-arabinose transferase-like glycosyltransferase
MRRAGFRERDFGFSAALFLTALLPRLYVAIAWAREPVWDGHYYDFGAKRIAAGFGYSEDAVLGGATVWHPWCHYPVGYSGLLALVYQAFGDGPHVATVTNAVIGALLAVVTHRLTRYATSMSRARTAGLLVALSPGLILYAAVLMTEPLAALGLLVTPWLFARDAEERPLRGALLAGIALGLTALVRPQSLLAAPALAFLVWKRGGGAPLARRSARLSAIALGVAISVVAPWTIRNCRVMDGCALVSTNAGWNLAIGSFPRATGRFETLRASDGCPIVTGQVQQDRCWLEEGVQWIEAEPLRWLALAPRKLAYTFDHESFPIGYLAEADPKEWPEERKQRGRALLTGLHRLLVAVAPLGLVALPWRRSKWDAASQALALAVIVAFVVLGLYSDLHPFWPLVLLLPVLALTPLAGAPARSGVLGYVVFTIVTVCVTHVLFFGEDRYHIVVTPAFCILAACALRRSAPRDGPAGGHA